MSDVFKSVKETFDDTFKKRWENPVWGPFLFSWTVWHWDMLLVIFAKGEYTDKLTYIYRVFPAWDLFWSSMGAIGTAILYLAIAPFHDPLLRWATAGAQLATDQAKRALDRAGTFTYEDIEGIKAEYLVRLQAIKAAAATETEKANQLKTDTEDTVQNAVATAAYMRSQVTEQMRIRFEFQSDITGMSPHAIRLPEGTSRLHGTVHYLETMGINPTQAKIIAKLSATIWDTSSDFFSEDLGTKNLDLSKDFGTLCHIGVIEHFWHTERNIAFKLSEAGEKSLEELRKLKAFRRAVAARPWHLSEEDQEDDVPPP